MSTLPSIDWKYLEPRPKSFYRQLCLKGTRIRARTLYGRYRSETAPETPEQIAAASNRPLEAVREAIACCASNPPEIEEDFRREEALMEATGAKTRIPDVIALPRSFPQRSRRRSVAHEIVPG